MKSIIIRNEIKKSDFIHVQLRTLLKNWGIRFLFFIFILAMLGYNLYGTMDYTFLLPGVILYIVLIPFLMYRNILHAYKTSAAIQEPTEVEISADKFIIGGQSFFFSTDWKNILKIAHVNNFLVLYNTRVTAYYVSLETVDEVDKIYLFDLMKGIAMEHNLKCNIK